MPKSACIPCIYWLFRHFCGIFILSKTGGVHTKMNDKDAYIKHLEKTINDLQNHVKNLTEMIMLLRREKFGSSS